MSRLNISYTVLSKRKLLKLVISNYMRGWDDPRMPTIKGLRRRGYTKSIMNAFCNEIGVTRNANTVQYERLAAVARNQLHERSPRVMAVLNPLRVELKGEISSKEITIPDFPFDASRGQHVVIMENTVFIDRSDFRLENEGGLDPDFYGLAPGKMVGLKYAFRIVCDSFETDATTGEVTVLHCTILQDKDRPDEKPKTSIQWVPLSTAVPIEARVYNHLFVTEEPSDEKWEEELNPESEIVMPKALVDASLLAHVGEKEKHVQFERIGFFIVDKDTVLDSNNIRNSKIVMNLTVNLKDSKPKSAAKDTGAASGANRSRKEEQERQLAEKMVRFDHNSVPFFVLTNTVLYSIVRQR
jgi:glutaminyl-tRNA synthetase